MALKDRLSQLEKQLPNQRQAEFEEKCVELAERIRKEAVEKVENAIKQGTYKQTTTGFFRNKKTTKSVSGKTWAILVYEGSPTYPLRVSPDIVSSDGDHWYWVRTTEEREIFRKIIKDALESEGFNVGYGVSAYSSTRSGPSVHYTIEWE